MVGIFCRRETFQERKAAPYFVSSAGKYSDGMTKNFPEKLFKEHFCNTSSLTGVDTI
jgi:hypothetical protein